MGVTPLRGLRDENNEFLPLRSLEQAERDMAWRELKGAAEAIERMESGVSVERGGVVGHALRSQVSQEAVRLPDEKGLPAHDPGAAAAVGDTSRDRTRSGSVRIRPSLLSSAAYILAGLVFLATWGLAVLLEEPGEKPTPPYYKTFQGELR